MTVSIIFFPASCKFMFTVYFRGARHQRQNRNKSWIECHRQAGVIPWSFLQSPIMLDSILRRESIFLAVCRHRRQKNNKRCVQRFQDRHNSTWKWLEKQRLAKGKRCSKISRWCLSSRPASASHLCTPASNHAILKYVTPTSTVTFSSTQKWHCEQSSENEKKEQKWRV